jgi:hypothetical protein
MVLEEVQFLEMLKTKAGTAGGVDLDGPADAERIRVGAGGARGAPDIVRAIVPPKRILA